jgi:hypothetical protein
MKTKFKVEVNPFKQKAVIYAKINNCKYEKTIYYENVEEWNSFEFGNKIFDIEFSYEGEFLVSIYPVKKNKVDFTKPCEVLLTINLMD